MAQGHNFGWSSLCVVIQMLLLGIIFPARVIEEPLGAIGHETISNPCHSQTKTERHPRLDRLSYGA